MTIDTFYNPKIITTTLIHFNRMFVLMLFLDGQTRALDDARVNAASSLVREALVLLQKSQGTQKIVSRLDARLQQHLKAFANDWLSDDPLSFQTEMQKNYDQILAQVKLSIHGIIYHIADSHGRVSFFCDHCCDHIVAINLMPFSCYQ